MSTQARSLTAIDVPPVVTGRRSAPLATFFAWAEKLLDFAAVLGAVYAAIALRGTVEPRQALGYSSSDVFFWAAGFALLFVFLLERYGGYRPSVSLLAIRETERILRVTLQAFLLTLLAAYLCGTRLPRLAFFFALATVPLSLTLEKWEMQRMLRRLRSKGYGAQRTIILGAGPEARHIYSALLRSPKFGLDPVAFVDDGAGDGTTEIYESSYQRKHSAKVLPGPLCPELFRQLDASVLVTAAPAMDKESMRLTLAKASQAGVRTYFAANDLLEPGYWMDYTELDGILLGHLADSANRTVYELGKRLLDVMVAAGLLLAFAFLAPIIALLVKFTSPGPVLFRQERAGKGGRRFTMYKFRTMYREAPAYGYSPGTAEDSRVTPLGRFLRRTSLDELPQLINVLLGQMSLVGPRPEMPFIVEQYTPLQRQRLAVKPGMTGLWQLSADRAFQIHENIEYDLYYVRHRSLFMDVAILLHTLLFAARGV